MNAAQQPAGPQLSIGALSKLTNCNIETIRYYERINLMPAPPRSAGGQRVYDMPHVQRLTFIRRCRELGFSLDEIRGLLQLVEDDRYTCEDVKTITLDHLHDVQHKISDLQRLAGVLKGMADECADGRAPGCPIVDALLRVS